MRDPLAILASTKNDNGCPIAAKRITEIYDILKGQASMSDTEIRELLYEALSLKKVEKSVIESCLVPATQIFCFPYAGGYAFMYEKWKEFFTDELKIEPLEYPGRGTKGKLRLVGSFDKLLDHLESEILSRLHGEVFAFFGHSLGAIVAFELAHRLQKRKLIPRMLFISGCPAPDSIPALSFDGNLGSEEFTESIRHLNGTPRELVDTEEFKEFFLPVLRNDFALLGDYIPPSDILVSPIAVFGGDKDVIVPIQNLENWKYWTRESTSLHRFDGDHFFIHEPLDVIKIIKTKL